MGRRPQPGIKERLLDACADHALAHGLPDRLGPLVAATGTSARMLIYHFGTRDALLQDVVRRARQRQVDLFEELLRARIGEPYAITLARAWASITGSAGQPYLQMFGQWRDSAVQQTGPDFRRAATTDWLGPLEDGLRSIGRPDLATVVLAVVRGLLMDLDATGDTARTTQALHDFLGTLDEPTATAAARTPPEDKSPTVDQHLLVPQAERRNVTRLRRRAAPVTAPDGR